MASREMGAHPSERSLTGAPTAWGRKRIANASPVLIMRRDRRIALKFADESFGFMLGF
jgi:hypothetical protein